MASIKKAHSITLVAPLTILEQTRHILVQNPFKQRIYLDFSTIFFFDKDK